MTGPVSGGTERGAGAPTRSTGIQGAVGAILVVLALGLTLRIILAFQLPGSGFDVDLGAFRYWASNLARHGPWGFYQRDFFHDYTPGYLYVLWLVGIAGQALGGIGDLIKVPPILADLAIGWLVYSMVLELGGRSRLALGGALLAVLNPISWFDSVVWGQVDSFGVVFLLLGLRALWRDQPERAAVFTVIAAIIKPQLGILVPLVAVVTIRRALWPAGGHGDPSRTGHPLRIVTTGIATGCITAILVACRSGCLDAVRPRAIDQVVKTGGGYPYLTVNAYNPWALVAGDTGESLARTGRWVCDAAFGAEKCGAGVAAFGGVPAIAIGSGLLVLGFLAVLAMVARRPDRLTLLVGLAVLSLAFFILPTRVHERYGFPFFALAAILAAISWRWRIAYVVLTVATLANMYVVLTTLYPDNPAIKDWLGIGPMIRSNVGIITVVILHTTGFVWAFLQLRRGPSEQLEDELDRASDLAWDDEPLEDAGVGAGPPLAPPGGGMPRPVPAGGGSAGAGDGDDSRGRDPDLDAPGRAVRAGAGRMGPRALVGPADSPGPVARAADRGRRSPRPTRPVDPRASSSSPAWPCARSGWPSRTRCTSTRSITPGRPPSSCSTGATANRTTSTSGRTRTWPSTRWRSGSWPGARTTSARRATSGSPSARRSSSRDAIDADATGDRAGERVYVSTGAELRAYDLRSRAFIGAVAGLDGLGALAYDPETEAAVPRVRRRSHRDDGPAGIGVAGLSTDSTLLKQVDGPIDRSVRDR